MMNKWLVILLLATGPAQAEFYTGNDLLERIRSRDSIERLEALLYIAGAADAHRGAVSCPTPEVTLGQVYDLVKNYLERNPERRHQPGDWIVAAAMRPVFPCRTRSGT